MAATDLVPGQSLAGSTQRLSAVYDLALLDLDGVVYVGPDAVPGAAEAITAARAAGMTCAFLTNNASRTAATVAEHLTRLGVPAEAADVVTSAQVGATLLAERLPAGARVLVVGGEGLQEALRAEGLTPVSSLDDAPEAVAQGFNPDLTWRQLAEGSHAVRAGLLWLATNLDLTVPTPRGPAPGNGSLVRLVATAAGRGPDLVAGKPSPEPFLDAVRRFSSSRPLAVGDRLDTDIEGAASAGIPSLAVLTGVSTASDLLRAPRGLRPGYIAENLAGLHEEHPEALVADGRAQCRAASVEADGTVVRVTASGDDPVDLLRAGCALSWWLADTGRDADLEELLAALAGCRAAAGWGR